MKKLYYVFAAIIISSFVFPLLPAKADGGMFPPDGYYLNETNQKAFIYYFDQTENLVLSVSYQGDSADFAWVIPTPSKPEIYKSDASIFTKLQKLTARDDTGTPTFGATLNSFGTSKSEPVEVIEEKTIDIYDTAILKATDDKALAKWLVEHKYTFPEDKSSMLKEYIDNGWYFAIAKIQNALINDTDIKTKLAEGTVTPLRLKFQSNKIIYPMKLTRLALDLAEKNSKTTPTPTSEVDQNSEPVNTHSPYSPHMGITLYVLSDAKMSQDMLTTTWANWINPTDINSLGETVVGENWLTSNNKMFLTKMSASLNIKNVDDDFLITKAADNNIYPTPVYKTFQFWSTNLIFFIFTIIIGILIPTSFIFIIFVILQSFVIKRAKWAFFIGIIYEILVCLSLIIAWFVIIFSINKTTKNFSQIFLESGTIGFILGSIIIITAAIFFCVKMVKKYNQKFYTKTK
ncbi:MAG: DUF2330 domain-containing protein [Candidatus Berkelbacteria bacterium]|nr:DUF2330 domain-containing protein [Candidatus Berkelbacteria bacterium]